VINSLSHVTKLRVVPRSTVFRYKGKENAPEQIGQELKVRGIVTGRVARHGDAYLVSAELTDVSRDAQLWGESYTRKLADIQNVQEDISKSIADNLRVELSGKEKQELAKRDTQNPEAYQLYLRGRFYWNQRTPEGVKKGLDYFQQAIQMDPNYALAWAGVADSYAVGNGMYLGLAGKESRPKSREAALKALALDDSLAEAHTTLADTYLYFDWNFTKAEAEFRKAIELNPNYPTAHQWYSELLFCTGRFDQSIAQAKRAVELDPQGAPVNYSFGVAYYYARRQDEAIEQFRRALQIDPDYAAAHRDLFWAYVENGKYAQAVEESQALLRIRNDPATANALGEAFQKSGFPGFLRTAVDLERRGRNMGNPNYTLAQLYSTLGEKSEAIAELEKVYAAREGAAVYSKSEPALEPLHSDPRFQDLLRRVGFPQ
jgi:tetratricopeptide (TPR) repeat protein